MTQNDMYEETIMGGKETTTNVCMLSVQRNVCLQKTAQNLVSDSWTHIERLRLTVRQTRSLMPSNMESFV